MFHKCNRCTIHWCHVEWSHFSSEAGVTDMHGSSREAGGPGGGDSGTWL